ncbi:uncharacterized protein LOC125463020 isoform X3 [Stegostoma tigrinum]|uniref:uncharacterized protein LOC125463020 isoform X3 n=1 Tax=Stegostoma tigrinum TaxID=3053191 RepID=UPI00202B2F63|nr:uncharacterized protein LOC125463020 isoform X3 [Stegostoma tigrinum]
MLFSAKMWQEVTLVVAVFVTVNSGDNPDLATQDLATIWKLSLAAVWDSTVFCQCQIPPFVKSAVLLDQHLIQGSFSVGQVVSYRCLPGYNRNDSTPNFVVCQADLTWSRPSMNCMPKECGSPRELENGYCIVSGQTFGDTATYHCNTGYQLLGRSQILCTIRGWSRSFLFCEPFLNDKNQASTPSTVSTIISTVYETTAQTRSLTTDGAQTNHSFTLPSSRPYNEDQPFIPSTVATTIDTMNETTDHTLSPTIDGARTNYSFTSLPSWFKGLASFIALVMDAEETAENEDTATYEQNQTDRSLNTSVNAVINKIIPPNKPQIPTENFEKSLTQSAAPNISGASQINRIVLIFSGLIIVTAIAIAITMIKYICVRRKSGSYNTGSEFLEHHKDMDLKIKSFMLWTKPEPLSIYQ